MVSRLLEAAGVSGLVFFAIGFEFSEFDDLGYVQHGEAFFVADPASSAVAIARDWKVCLQGVQSLATSATEESVIKETIQ